MNVIFLPAAQADTNAAAEWYELGRPGLGQDFLDAVDDAVNLVRDHRRAGQLGFGSEDEVRSFPLRRFPYRVIYQIRHHDIVVVALSHNRTKPDHWRNRVQEKSAVYSIAA